ncbi:3-oxo-tetronate kinase [Azospirillum sp.]|uniref:3-oxo-tetronate kinase n=1 Tax=Azospirillum sp. TaxID=34012 RepID=UPI003D750A6A
MTLALGCIADDYTGASDLANTLTRAGLRTVQTIGVPDAALALPEVDAVVVSLKSRSIPAEQAVALSLDAHRWLTARGAARVLFKVCSTFDSTDRGNIGPVTDALRAAAGGGIAMVTPAFPETGRTVYMGHLFVGPVPLHESPLKDHPLNPMRDSNLVRVLARQSQTGVGLVDRATVERGADAVEARLAELAAAGMGSAIIDAVSDGDLETIGAVAAKRPVSTGASGLGLGIARALVAAGTVRLAAGNAGAVLAPVGGHAAVVAGSCSRATLEQLAVAEASMPMLRLDPARLLDGDGEIERALAFAAERLPSGPVVIASSATPDAVEALHARFGREATSHRIEHATAEIVARLVAAGVRRLVVAGGETSGAAVDRLGIPAFLVGPEIAPGVPVLRTTGSGDDLLMALKSGNFGGPDFFAKALGLMR